MKMLVRGQKLKLSEISSQNQFVVGIHLAAPSLVLDVSCFGLDANGVLSDDRFFVFYNQTAAPSEAIKLLGAQGDASTFWVDLTQLSASITRLVFVVSVDGMGALSDVQKGSFWLEVEGKQEILFALDNSILGDQSAATLVELTNVGSDDWELEVLGQSFTDGLGGLLQHFGGQVSDEDTELAAQELPFNEIVSRSVITEDDVAEVPDKPSKPVSSRPASETRNGIARPVAVPVTEEFCDSFRTFVARIPEIWPNLQSEEATKNALVLPFLGLLGYDVFNPLEVIPEFTADHGIKKGEKVDYALKLGDRITMLFECKRCGSKLDPHHASQLFRYFTVTEARVGVLTDGIEYQFYADLESANKMDMVPFLKIDLRHLHEEGIGELAKLSKAAFNVEHLLTGARELKYLRAVQGLLGEQMVSPSDEFLRFFASKVGYGTLHAARRAQFSQLTKQAFQNLIIEAAKERLQDAIEASDSLASQSPLASSVVTLPAPKASKGDEASDDEWQGFFIIKAILRQSVAPSRIIDRPTMSYFGIVLDGNSRKPLARLYFNGSQKYLGLFNEERQERRIPIDDLNNIFLHADELKRVLSFYEK